jgi:thioredoxin 1
MWVYADSILRTWFIHVTLYFLHKNYNKQITMAAVYTDSNFDTEVIKADKLSIVDFWAPWCGPCLALGPTIEALAKEYDGKVNVGKINIDDNPEVSVKYGITSIPCVLFIKDGKVVDKQVGAAPKNAYDKKIQKILAS